MNSDPAKFIVRQGSTGIEVECTFTRFTFRDRGAEELMAMFDVTIDHRRQRKLNFRWGKFTSDR